MGGPLSGCRVIELSHIMAGPACGLMRAKLPAVLNVKNAA